MRHAAVVFADETGWPHAGANAWLWLFATTDAALVRIRRSRGHEVAKEVLFEPDGKPFGGKLVTDGWAAYDALKLDPANRQQCLRHIINRAAELEAAQTGPAKAFPRAVLEVMRDALAVKTWQPHLDDDEYAGLCEWTEAKLDRTLRGHVRDPVNARFSRFLKHRQSLLVFLPDPLVPGTNNQAERGIRPMILPRKTCGGTRSDDGLLTHEVSSSVIETCHRQGRPVLPFLAACYQRQQPALGLR